MREAGRLTQGCPLRASGRRRRTVPDALLSETGERLARVPAHRAFWFGWIAQHPETVLFK